MPGTFRQIQIFALVCNRGSVSAAAEALGISQASASRQINALEVALGQSLLDRRPGRRNVPSQAGRAIFDHALATMKERAKMEAALASSGRTLRVGADNIIYNLIFAPAHAHLTEELGSDRVDFTIVEPGADPCEELRLLDLDLLYFTAGPGEQLPRDAIRVALGYNDLFAAPSLLNSLGSGAALPIILPSPSERVRQGVSNIINERLPIAFKLVAADVDPSASMELMMRGLGAGLVSQRRAAPYVAAGLLQRVEAFSEPVEVGRYQLARHDYGSAGAKVGASLRRLIEAWSADPIDRQK